jgi:5,10-methylenetetrahydromethanopterin reductase
VGDEEGELAQPDRADGLFVALDREGYSGPEDAALIGDEPTVWQNLDELRNAGVDEFVGISFDPTPEGGLRTRACLRAWESRASNS